MVKKTYYNRQITEIENKIPSVTNLVATAPRNSKATEIEKKSWYYITNLVTKDALNTRARNIENKIPDIIWYHRCY